jgi:phosphohistidine phosphatase
MDDERNSSGLQLYIVRHAAAEDPSPGVPDGHRALTEKGRERFRKTARKLSGKVRSIDLILTSPLVRAVQTAEILACEVAHESVRVLPELAGHPAQALVEAVSRADGKHRSVALVGHEPQLTELIATYLRLEPDRASALHLRKGAVVLLEVSGPAKSPKAQARWWMRSGESHDGLPEMAGEE